VIFASRKIPAEPQRRGEEKRREEKKKKKKANEPMTASPFGH